MTIKEFIAATEVAHEDEEIVSKVEKAFGCTLSLECKKIISFNENGNVFDDVDIRRLMSLDEILHSSEELHVDFVGAGVIPIVDCGDNDFACYNFKSGKWCKYNIIELCMFSARDAFSQLW